MSRPSVAATSSNGIASCCACICAVAASILTAVYHMLRDGTFYQDFGADHFHKVSPEAQANRMVRQIVKRGFTCPHARVLIRGVCLDPS